MRLDLVWIRIAIVSKSQVFIWCQHSPLATLTVTTSFSGGLNYQRSAQFPLFHSNRESRCQTPMPDNLPISQRCHLKLRPFQFPFSAGGFIFVHLVKDKVAHFQLGNSAQD